MKSYVFIANGNKPSYSQAENREMVKLTYFSLPYIEKAIEMNYKVFFGVNRNKPEELKSNLPINFYDSHTYRSIFDLKSNMIAYKNLMHIIKKNDIEVIHCNTPVGGIIGRLCGKKGKVKKIIYTVHGFHFYKGGSIIKNLIYKTAEKMMARMTDAIITINKEDYLAAQKFNLRGNGKVYFVPGVGVDTRKYLNTKIDKVEYRKLLGFKKDDILCISMGDLVKRKNYTMSIKAIASINNPRLHYIICGKGPEERKLKSLAKKLGVNERIHFLGYRSDIEKLLKISDIFLFSSKQEGLPRSLMEAMSAGLPCVVSEIRGNVDLIDSKGGFLCNNLSDYISALKILLNDVKIMEELGCYNLSKIKDYDISIVKKKVNDIYEDILRK